MGNFNFYFPGSATLTVILSNKHTLTMTTIVPSIAYQKEQQTFYSRNYRSYFTFINCNISKFCLVNTISLHIALQNVFNNLKKLQIIASQWEW